MKSRRAHANPGMCWPWSFSPLIPSPQWRVLNHAARQAIKAKDYAKLRETLLALKPLMPGNPSVIYNLGGGGRGARRCAGCTGPAAKSCRYGAGL